MKMVSANTDEKASNIELFLRNNSAYLKKLRNTKKYWATFRLNPRMRRLYAEYEQVTGTEEKNAACAKVLNAFQETLAWRVTVWWRCFRNDVRVGIYQLGKRQMIDRSEKKKGDYYSVAVIIKNEARYIREFILFYRATGADRIYIYDNDSNDNLMEIIKPFLESGLVVYRKWPGRNAQTSAYRDAIRRTKRRTKWLAIVDADEFLFSPIQGMPEQLRQYEQYPGIGVNWVMYGPNGHKNRPEGLVIDNYTTTLADHDALINCHIKSIVQPKMVRTMNHTHYCWYKKNRSAVDPYGGVIDNTNAYKEGVGRVFSAKNCREVFRINHYVTKSEEELRKKRSRGYADGAPSADYELHIRTFEVPLVEDYSIKPYADIVRENMKKQS